MVHPDLLASTPIPHLLWALAANGSQQAQFPRALSLVKGGRLAPRFLTAHSQGMTYMVVTKSGLLLHAGTNSVVQFLPRAPSGIRLQQVSSGDHVLA